MEIKAVLVEALRCAERARRLHPPKSDVELSALRWELHAALQNTLDAIAMLISDLGLRKPSSYSELGRALTEAGLIGSDLEDAIAKTAKIRNLLAHAYRRLSQEDLGAIIESVLPEAVRIVETLLKLREEKSVDPSGYVEIQSSDQLRRTLERHGVLLAYLFGSRARGTAREDSDYDIAVLFGREATLIDELELSLEIAKALHEPPERVDVVALDLADTLLKLRVLREGELLYAFNDEFRRKWERKAYVEALAEHDLYSVFLKRALKIQERYKHGL